MHKSSTLLTHNKWKCVRCMLRQMVKNEKSHKSESKNNFYIDHQQNKTEKSWKKNRDPKIYKFSLFSF